MPLWPLSPCRLQATVEVLEGREGEGAKTDGPRAGFVKAGLCFAWSQVVLSLERKSYDMSRDMGRQEGSSVKRLWISILWDLVLHKKSSLQAQFLH